MRNIEKIKHRIYSDYEVELNRACQDDDMYDKLMGEKSIQAAFELGALYMLKHFSRETNVHHKQGVTESDKEYIKRLENDLTEYSCSNAGWRHAFTGQ